MIRLDSPSMFSSLVTNRWGIREYLPSQIMGLEEGQSFDIFIAPLGFQLTFFCFDYSITSALGGFWAIGLTQGLDLILMPGTVKTTPFINMALVEQRETIVVQ